MQLTKLFVCFSALVTKVCVAGLIIETSKLDESVVKASIDILESCYTDQISTVGLAGISIESIVNEISQGDSVIPVTLIDDKSSAVNGGPVDRGSRYKLQIFAITANNPVALVKTLIQIRKSKWWNHMASFLLIDVLGKENGCSNAREILWEAWKINLLNAKFLCNHRTNERLIYTFNPYTGKAPDSWKKQGTYKGINDHIWTLFARKYREDNSHCDELDFDKTSDLGGYEIRASIQGMENWWYADPNKKPTIANRVRHVTAQIFMNSLNATWKLLLRHGEGIPTTDQNGDPVGIAAEVINGISDICLNPIMIQVWTKYECTYPHYTAALAIMTQYRGYKSQLEKLISVLDKKSRFCVFVVLLITLLFFKLYFRDSLTLAILNLVLIICNAAIRRMPRNLVPRIYLGSLFVLVVTIQGIYQGQFATLLTKQVRLPGIDSMIDLERSDYTVYGMKAFRSFFNESTIEGRYVDIPDLNCTGFVLRDSKSACLGGNLWLLTEAVNAKLHLTRESMRTLFAGYLVRRDWPLEERVNTIHHRAITGDIVRPLYMEEIRSAMRTLQSYEYAKRQLKPLTLSQLGFAFVMLAMGLGCATIAFVIEVSTYDTAMVKPPRRIRRRIAWTAYDEDPRSLVRPRVAVTISGYR